MYHVLIVDDEEYAIEGLRHAIDWEALGFGTVDGALDAEEARRCFARQAYDVMICDIEMPGENGLELLEWVREHHPGTETLFLTAHADFSYAQQAVRLGSSDYLLKPVNYAQLFTLLGKLVSRVEQTRETQRFNELSREYQARWEAKKPRLEEHFWLDYLARKWAPGSQTVLELLAAFEPPLTPDTRVLPLVISTEEWKKELSAKDEDIMEYALRNAAGELLLQGQPGIVLQDRLGNNLLLAYGPEGDARDAREWVRRCREYMAACETYFYCSLSCYIGEPVPLGDVWAMYVKLLETEQNNVSGSRGVHVYAEPAAGSTPGEAAVPAAPWFPELAVLFELGKEAELLAKLDELLGELGSRPNLASETLHTLYHAILHMVYQVFHRRGIPLREAVPARELADAASAARSLPQFRAWAHRLLPAAAGYLRRQGAAEQTVMDQVLQYIEQRLDSEISREELAAYVHFNPAYLSRLFKKETGSSLTDFILARKMDKAKGLLGGTGLKIGDIATSVGYANIPHFTKMFKKSVGVTPQEYRKQSMG